MRNRNRVIAGVALVGLLFWLVASNLRDSAQIRTISAESQRTGQANNKVLRLESVALVDGGAAIAAQASYIQVLTEELHAAGLALPAAPPQLQQQIQRAQQEAQAALQVAQQSGNSDAGSRRPQHSSSTTSTTARRSATTTTSAPRSTTTTTRRLVCLAGVCVPPLPSL